MVTDWVEILRPAEVPAVAGEAADRLVEKAAQDWPGEIEVARWYHDAPVWFISDRALGSSWYRVMQVTAIRDRGSLWFELAIHREYRGEDVIYYPANTEGGVRVKRLSITANLDDLDEEAEKLWGEKLPKPPDDPAHAPDWESVQLSPALRKSL